MKSKLVSSLIVALLLGGSFVFGQFSVTQKPAVIETVRVPEISLIVLKAIKGDLLDLEISGPARILWGEDNMVEKDGTFQIPLGQILHDQDQKYLDFAFVGNAKTGKFYPSSSYPARGTEVQHRRFFATKQAALEAGFIATKLVK